MAGKKIGLYLLCIIKRVGGIQLKPTFEGKDKENGVSPFLGLPGHLLMCLVLNPRAWVLQYRPVITFFFFLLLQ